MCVRCAFSLVSLFWAFYAITVLPFIRWSQGSTLGFRPLSTWRRFASRKSIQSEFFCPQLRLYDPCTSTNVSSWKILAHYAENEQFPLPIPSSLLFCGTLCYRDWTQPRKRSNPSYEGKNSSGIKSPKQRK